MTAAVRLSGLRVYRGSTLVIDEAALNVAKASWYGLIGANGSGKTSLLRALAGRLPIAAGVCELDGDDLAASRKRRAEFIGFMPPGEMLPDVLTPRQVLDLVAPDTVDWRQALDPLADALALGALLDRKIGTFSTGMRQRIAIACAFASGHDVVVLDEPFNTLDPVAAFDLRKALRKSVDNGLTLITALHDMMTLAAVCDEGALLGNGRVSLSLGRDDIASGARDLAGFEGRLIAALRNYGPGESARGD